MRATETHERAARATKTFPRDRETTSRIIGAVCSACLGAAGATIAPSACFWGCGARFGRVSFALVLARAGELEVEYVGIAWGGEARRAVEAFVKKKAGHQVCPG